MVGHVEDDKVHHTQATERSNREYIHHTHILFHGDDTDKLPYDEPYYTH